MIFCCNQLSHCLHNNSIIYHSVKIIYWHVIAIYHQHFVFFEDPPVVAFLFLPLFFSTFSLEKLSLQLGFLKIQALRIQMLNELCSPVKIYSHGISRSNPLPRITAFPHMLTTPSVPGYARKCCISPKPSFILTNIKGMCPMTQLSSTMLNAFVFRDLGF